MKSKILHIFFFLSILYLFNSINIFAATVQYIESFENFRNPERGFREGSWLGDMLNHMGSDMVRAYIVVPEFLNSDFSQGYLDDIKNKLQSVRTSNSGTKVVLRITYNFPTGGGGGNYQNAPDATIEQMERQIKQLGPIFKDYEDVVIGVEAGFIGAWGEWHDSVHKYDENPDAMKRIVFGWTNVLSPNQMVYIRYPNAMYQVIGAPATFSDAFDSTNPKAHIGLYNDCFLANERDAGTYNTDPKYGYVPTELNTYEKQKQYIADQTKYTESVGEVCGDVGGGRFSCDNAKNELDRFNFSFLYYGGLDGVLKSQGCYDEVARSLGYRFVLKTATLPDVLKPGANLDGSFTIRNVGYSNMARYRPVELILKNTSGEWGARLNINPRLFTEDTDRTEQIHVKIPNDMPAGTYDAYLRLPDRGQYLYNNPKYSVQLANTGVWEGTSGMNKLNLQVKIDPNVSGNVGNYPVTLAKKGNEMYPIDPNFVPGQITNTPSSQPSQSSVTQQSSLTQSSTTVQSSAQSSAPVCTQWEAGDLSCNNTISDEDYTIWENAFQTASITYGDVNHDGYVNLFDYETWRKNTSTTFPSCIPDVTSSQSSVTQQSSLTQSSTTVQSSVPVISAKDKKMLLAMQPRGSYGDITTLASRANYINTMPIDGLIIFADSTALMYKGRTITYDQAKQDLSRLSSVTKEKYLLVLMDKPGEWNDDVAWDRVLNNYKEISLAMKDLGWKGFAFDNEGYQVSYDDMWGDNVSPSMYPYIRKQAKRITQAIGSVMPDAMYMIYNGPMISDESCPRTPVGGEVCPDGWPNISDWTGVKDYYFGLIDGKTPQMTIVDGNGSHTYRQEQQFINSYNYRKYNIPNIPTELKNSYSNITSIAFSIYNQNYVHDMNPQIYEQVLTYALKHNDTYVWLYTEPPECTAMNGCNCGNFINPGSCEQGYLDAMKKARQNIGLQ